MKNFLKQIASEFPDDKSGACIIANMHALPTVSTLFDVALDKGFSAENILFFGKPYSTIDTTQRQLEAKGIAFTSVAPQFFAGQLIQLHNRLLREQLSEWCPQKRTQNFILLDSGGYLTREFDQSFRGYRRISIQLTSSGSRLWPIGAHGLVDLGISHTKKSFESSFIAEAIYSEMEEKIKNLHNKKICIIGNGAIGQSVSQLLNKKGIAHSEFSGTENPIPLVNSFSVIIGATGYDISALAIALSSKAENVDFVSCSSWDVEFRELLLATNIEVNLETTSQSAVCIDDRITIHNAGCPINFNRRSEREPEQGIAMTRGLALAALLGSKINDQMILNVEKIYRQNYDIS